MSGGEGEAKSACFSFLNSSISHAANAVSWSDTCGSHTQDIAHHTPQIILEHTICETFHITPHTSHLTPHTSHVSPCPISHHLGTYHTSQAHITYNTMSHITQCYISHNITYHTISHVTHNTHRLRPSFVWDNKSVSPHHIKSHIITHHIISHITQSHISWYHISHNITHHMPQIPYV